MCLRVFLHVTVLALVRCLSVVGVSCHRVQKHARHSFFCSTHAVFRTHRALAAHTAQHSAHRIGLQRCSRSVVESEWRFARVSPLIVTNPSPSGQYSVIGHDRAGPLAGKPLLRLPHPLFGPLLDRQRRSLLLPPHPLEDRISRAKICLLRRRNCLLYGMSHPCLIVREFGCSIAVCVQMTPHTTTPTAVQKRSTTQCVQRKHPSLTFSLQLFLPFFLCTGGRSSWPLLVTVPFQPRSRPFPRQNDGSI